VRDESTGLGAHDHGGYNCGGACWCGTRRDPRRELLHHAIHHLALLARTNRSIATVLSVEALAALLPLAPVGAGAFPGAWVA
jgi:hypothetical protein